MILRVRQKDGTWLNINAIKGDAFTFEDFTPEQLEMLKGEPGPAGEPFKYEDFTPEQLEALRGPAGADGKMSFTDLTEEQKASLKGDKGDKGDSYTLTDTDKEDIVAIIRNYASIPTMAAVKEYLDVRLGDIENGAY